MGSLENGLSPSVKRAPLLRSHGSCRSIFHRPRSRLARFLLVEKLDYLQWICTVIAFFLVIFLFQALLPGSVVEKSGEVGDVGGFLNEIGDLDFGEGIRFFPSKLVEKWEKEKREANSSSLGRTVRRIGLRRPLIALVVPELRADGMQLEMVSIAVVLKEIGYDIQVYSLHDGPSRAAWRAVGMQVNILSIDVRQHINVDWLDYNGIIVSSLDSRPVISW